MSQTVASSAGTVVDDFTVTRDAVGSVRTRISTVDPADAWTYAYDTLGRLVTADNSTTAAYDESYAYDAIGNVLSVTRGGSTTSHTFPSAGFARPHAPTSIGGLAARYDANGNRLAIGAAPDASFDAENRMSSDGTTAYLYDAEGTRVVAGTTKLVRDLLQDDGATSLRFYYLGRERIARRDQSGVVSLYHGDDLGTVRRSTATSGAQASRKVVSPFGRILAASGVADPFALAGQRLDPSGLYHMGARYMDPAVGQFTSPDPSDAPDPARPQSLNRYTYAANDPMRLTDPTGFQEVGTDGKKTDSEEQRRKRLQRSPSPSVTFKRRFDPRERPSGAPLEETFTRPRLFSEEYEADERNAGTTSLGRWAHESATGYVYSDRESSNSSFLPNGEPNPEAAPMTAFKFDGATREDLKKQFRSVTTGPKGTFFPLVLEGTGSGLVERANPDGSWSIVPDPRAIVNGPLDTLWLYEDDPLSQ